MRRTQFRILALLAVLGTAMSSLSQSTVNVLHNFTGGADGADPLADLVYDPLSGFFYGTTNLGGGSDACPRGCGTVFAIRPGGVDSGYSVLHSFGGAPNGDGANPEAALVVDGAGNLYGTTYRGGAHNLGTVFQLSPQPGGLFKETILFSFSSPDGSLPLGRLIFDSSGNLYGTTLMGGANNHGTVFRLTPAGQETVVHSFAGPDGANPRAGVVFDSSGFLWGTTYVGGASNLGVVFQMTPDGAETFLFSFAGPDGANPRAPVTLDNSGNVFGTTQFGGAPFCTFAPSGCGVVFELQPGANGRMETVLYNFIGGLDGAAPIAGLTLAPDMSGSDLYGTASQAGMFGGACSTIGCGTAFELCGVGSSCAGQAGWTLYTLFDFDGKSGSRPAAGLQLVNPGTVIPGGAGRGGANLPPPTGHGGCPPSCMGSDSAGGSNGNGTVYEVP